MRNTSLEVLEGRIGYHFKDIYLLECALTHTSFANEHVTIGSIAPRI